MFTSMKLHSEQYGSHTIGKMKPKRFAVKHSAADLKP